MKRVAGKENTSKEKLLGPFFNLARSYATGAHANALRHTVHVCLNSLNVWLGGPLGFDIRVADQVACNGFLAAYFTSVGHSSFLFQIPPFMTGEGS